MIQVVRLKSSLTLEATHKRLHGALDTFNGQMMVKPSPPVAPIAGSTPHAGGTSCRNHGRGRGILFFVGGPQYGTVDFPRPLLVPIYACLYGPPINHGRLYKFLLAWQVRQMETALQAPREEGTLCGPGGSCSLSTFRFSGWWRLATKMARQVPRERTWSLPLGFVFFVGKMQYFGVQRQLLTLYQRNALNLTLTATMGKCLGCSNGAVIEQANRQKACCQTSHPHRPCSNIRVSSTHRKHSIHPLMQCPGRHKLLARPLQYLFDVTTSPVLHVRLSDPFVFGVSATDPKQHGSKRRKNWTYRTAAWTIRMCMG